jgi:hypothetical protein
LWKQANAFVSGNENGIAFDPEQGELEYLYMHSHPENLDLSAEDYMSLYNLNQSEKRNIFYIHSRSHFLNRILHFENYSGWQFLFLVAALAAFVKK